MLDFATIIGLLAGLAVLVAGVFSTPGGDLAVFISAAAFFITIGGATAATFVSYPIAEMKALIKVIKFAFVTRPASPQKLIADFRKFADVARRDGILALENVTGDITDPFLIRGIQLAVDGTDPEVINFMMQTELEQINERHERGIKILKQFALYVPSFGMIGTLIGLVIMLKNLKDPDSIGPAMAVALITTLYGAIAAYLFATPFAEKLGRRDKEETLIKEMMIKGVMSIQSGDNPRIVEQKLLIFLSPKQRELAGTR